VSLAQSAALTVALLALAAFVQLMIPVVRAIDRMGKSAQDFWDRHGRWLGPLLTWGTIFLALMTLIYILTNRSS
jgi:hypothetical protein